MSSGRGPEPEDEVSDEDVFDPEEEAQEDEPEAEEDSETP